MIQIGEQVWMAQNFNVRYMQPTSSLDPSSFCYGNSIDSCAKYGRLYSLSAVIDSAAIFSEDGNGCGSGKTCAHAYFGASTEFDTA